MIRGPKINLSAEEGTITVSSEMIAIEGTVNNVNELILDGLPIAIDEEGAFSEQRLLVPGNNDFLFEASDQYNRTISKTLRVLYRPNKVDVQTTTTMTETTDTQE